MIFGSILDQNDWARILREQVLEKGLIAVAVETIFNPSIKQSSAEELDQAENLVAFAYASGFD